MGGQTTQKLAINGTFPCQKGSKDWRFALSFSVRGRRVVFLIISSISQNVILDYAL
jgi:hypothetical protein